jgi:outer membrane lipoprotein carrier protein
MLRNELRVGYLTAATLFLAACGGAEAGESAEKAASAPPAAERPAAPAAPATAAPGESAPAAAPAPGESAPARSPAAAPAQSPAPVPAGPLRPGRPMDTSPSIPVDRAELPPAEAAGEGEGDAAAILRRAERTYAGVRSMEADFAQEVTVPLLDQTQRSRGKIYHRRPNHFLMKFSDPAGDVVVADGRAVWMYYPSTDRKQVIKSAIGDGSRQVDLQEEFLRDATSRYSARLVGSETVAGEATHVLVLTPKARGQYRSVKVWVDQSDNLVRRFEVTEENDSVRRLELRNIRVNPALSDALFAFSPPPGTQVFQQ